jgi:pimeloyl-ACP methyl ester carboxylesterase
MWMASNRSDSAGRRCRSLPAVIAAVAMTTVLVLVAACEREVSAIFDECPDDDGGIHWTPDVGAPVFYGHQDFTTGDGAPRDLRVYYPSVEGVPTDAPLLTRCLVQWPVVLLLHGQPPADLVGDLEYHQRWSRVAGVLARSGYVVVVPSVDHHQVPRDPDPVRDEVLAAMDWVRSDWAESKWVHPELAAVAGHSLGGVLATHVATANPDIRALVSFSGDFINRGRIDDVAVPSLFFWVDQSLTEDIDLLGLWDQLSMPRYRGVFDGEHFDYLRPADTGPATPRGDCDSLGPATADLAALFIARTAPGPFASHQPAEDLRPPSVDLTDQQRFFAGAHLEGLGAFDRDPDCQLDLRWELDGSAGGRDL